jgi:hypothetical protein
MKTINDYFIKPYFIILLIWYFIASLNIGFNLFCWSISAIKFMFLGSLFIYVFFALLINALNSDDGYLDF